ncbi:MAG: ribonuclease H-like domain-containing protein, partial [Anaerolineales bacterium]
MPSLSDKLKSLGVKTGAEIRPPAAPKPTRGTPIEAVFPNGQKPSGRALLTRRGEAFVVEDTYIADYRHGQAPIRLEAALGTLAAWAVDERISRLSLSDLAFLDTETSGLSGGTGTYAFMVGVGRFMDGEFRLAQFFMRDPGEEAAMLEAIADFIAPCAALVTYNGKAFDAPLLRTRYTLH